MLSIRHLPICNLPPENIKIVMNRKCKEDDVKGKEKRRGYSKNINKQIVKPEMFEGKKVILSEAKSMVWKDTEDIGNIKLLLSKLTPDNYEKVFAKIQNYSQHEQILASEIYKKAWSEPKYAKVYSNLCFDLAEHEMITNNLKNRTYSNFRKCIILSCQATFKERHILNQSSNVDLGEMNEEEKENELLKQRKKIQGTMQFLGELFRKRLLHVSVISVIFEELLDLENKQGEQLENDLEASKILMENIGQMLDDPSAKFTKCYKSVVNNIFQKYKDLMNNNAIDSRIKCLLKVCIYCMSVYSLYIYYIYIIYSIYIELN